MNNVHKLNEKWIKASVLGTIWASSEIVLGSFLHNLKIPFSGNILTAIGVVILISASYKWKEKGLFWRAGLICALLKTLSPSAVIFGPMVAIFSEAVLLEISTRILGRSIPGYLVGAILAMSWNLFQRVFNYIVYYGQNIIDVYTNLMRYAETQFGLRFDAVWAPLLLLLGIYALFGAFSALTGIYTGRSILKNPLPISSLKINTPPLIEPKKRNFNYSALWLIINLILLLAILLLIGRINFWLWVCMVCGVAFTWSVRYKRALRQLMRPKLWIFFVAITMVSGFVFTRIQSDSNNLYNALLIGVEMNLRAISLIMGFTVLGTELYNPRIRKFFAERYFSQLPLALELSTESLPVIIANIPDFKTIVKNPFLFVQQIMAFADYRLKEIKIMARTKKYIVIVTGDVGAGKTSCIEFFIDKMRQKNVSVSGFYSLRKMANNFTTGYNIVDVGSGNTTNFLSVEGTHRQSKIGRYYINEEGIRAAVGSVKESSAQITIIDEIGKMELAGEGFASLLQNQLSNQNGHLLLSLRKEIIYELLNKFEINPEIILDVSHAGCREISEKMEKIFTVN